MLINVCNNKLPELFSERSARNWHGGGGRRGSEVLTPLKILQIKFVWALRLKNVLQISAGKKVPGEERRRARNKRAAERKKRIWQERKEQERRERERMEMERRQAEEREKEKKEAEQKRKKKKVKQELPGEEMQMKVV